MDGNSQKPKLASERLSEAQRTTDQDHFKILQKSLTPWKQNTVCGLKRFIF